MSTLVILAGLIIFGLLAGLLSFYGSITQKKADEYSSEIQNIDNQINALQDKKDDAPLVNINEIIDIIANQNVIAINFYDSISTDIPKNVWLTQYYNQTGDKLAIKGIAENITDIYEYYKNLRVVSPKSNIKLTELKVLTDAKSQSEKYINNLLLEKDFDRLYTFEISNTEIQYNQDPQAQEGASPNDGNSEIEIIKRKPIQTQEEGKNAKPIDRPSQQMKLAR